MTPTGMLTKKIHSHPSHFVRHSAHQHADGRAAPAHRAPDSERLVPLGAFLERRRDDRERRGREDRGAEALHRASRDQHPLGVGQTAGERGGREQRDADHEHAPAPEQIGRAPAEEQEAAEGRARTRERTH